MIKQICFAVLLLGGLTAAGAEAFGEPVVDATVRGLRFYCGYDQSEYTLVDAEAVVAAYLPTKGMMGVIPFKKKSDAVSFVACYKMLASAAERLTVAGVDRMETALLRALGDVKFTEPKPICGEIVFATTPCEELDFTKIAREQ